MARFNTDTDTQLPPEHRRLSPKPIVKKVIEIPVVEGVGEQTETEKPSFVDRIFEKVTDPNPVIHQDAVVFTRGVVSEAIARGASDIHFEPRQETYQIRFRVDGVLRQYDVRPLQEYQSIINSVRVLADMDISEHAIPQDGHIELVQEEVERHIKSKNLKEEHIKVPVNKSPSLSRGRYFDIRVSVFPSINGEVVVMRILNRNNAILTIEELGMDSESLQKLNEALLTSFGMILITGPTGSGKTTTLYSVLNELRNDEKNIITLEDPIEFHLDWLRQCEIREERGFTFEKAMESVLRQDPDILMVGEIRDPHTAEHAVRSALVGRIVGSTIHANSTIGTIARLFELGIPRSIVGHTLNAIIAQRLVRRSCDACREEYTPDAKLLAHFELEKDDGPFTRGKGCEVCNYTGFKGRMGIFSIMTFDEKARNLLFDEHPLTELEEYALKSGMRTLRMDAAMKILAGETTAEEAARVI